VTGEWRKLHNEDLHNLYSSPDIIRHIKLSRMRWTGHVAHMGEERKLYMIWWERPKKRNHWEDQGIGGRMESEYILGDWLWGGGRLDSADHDRYRWCSVVSEVMNLRVLSPRSWLVIVI
jgi:hypothetical protein